MQRRLITLSICALALAGCQTMGGHPVSTPAPPPPASGSSSAVAPTVTPGTPAQPSPWEVAREHGMVFRASGNQPGWSVEVQKSHTPTLFIVLDDSQRHMQVPQATIFSDPKTGTVGFRGSAQDGTPVELTIRRGQCQDNMSGAKLAAAAELDVGAAQYKGCGRFLFQ
ncbi:MAG TPA: hypothetical protein VFJ01_05290 [Oleiagrimonas sp.]|nr:hypothetical protein [Oleiagrimonas sp.]